MVGRIGEDEILIFEDGETHSKNDDRRNNRYKDGDQKAAFARGVPGPARPSMHVEQSVG